MFDRGLIQIYKELDTNKNKIFITEEEFQIKRQPVNTINIIV